MNEWTSLIQMPKEITAILHYPAAPGSVTTKSSVCLYDSGGEWEQEWKRQLIPSFVIGALLDLPLISFF